MLWKKLLALVTGSIDEELRLRNGYLVTENRILRTHASNFPVGHRVMDTGSPSLWPGRSHTSAAIRYSRSP